MYTSQEYQQALTGAGVMSSFSDVGKCFDNAPKESWFGTLKVGEEVARGLMPSCGFKLDTSDAFKWKRRS